MERSYWMSEKNINSILFISLGNIINTSQLHNFAFSCDKYSALT